MIHIVCVWVVLALHNKGSRVVCRFRQGEGFIRKDGFPPKNRMSKKWKMMARFALTWKGVSISQGSTTYGKGSRSLWKGSYCMWIGGLAVHIGGSYMICRCSRKGPRSLSSHLISHLTRTHRKKLTREWCQWVQWSPYGEGCCAQKKVPSGGYAWFRQCKMEVLL